MVRASFSDVLTAAWYRINIIYIYAGICGALYRLHIKRFTYIAQAGHIWDNFQRNNQMNRSRRNKTAFFWRRWRLIKIYWPSNISSSLRMRHSAKNVVPDAATLWWLEFIAVFAC